MNPNLARSAGRQVEELLLLGTSMGGTRPKAVVQDDHNLWIAKFSNHEERWNHPRVEHCLLRLAQACGLNVADSRIETVAGRDVLLVRRLRLTLGCCQRWQPCGIGDAESISDDGGRRMDAMNMEEWKALGSLQTVHGRTLFVVDTRGEGPALVLLHGYPTSSHDYHRALPDLAAHYRVIVHDHLGFGFSEKPRDYSYSLHEQADMAQLLWQHLGVESAHIVAHDYGTSVATEIVARWNRGHRPVDLRSLTLCNGSVHIELARLRLIQKLLRNRTLGPLVARFSSKRVFARNMRKLWCDPSLLLPADIDTMWALLTRDGGKQRLPQITQYLRNRVLFWHRWVDALQQCTLPTYILWGAEDPITGREVAQVHHDEIPDSELRLLDGVGHYPMLEAPGRWSGALVRGAAEHAPVTRRDRLSPAAARR